MFSYNSPNNCLPTSNYTNPCSTTLPYNNGNSSWTNTNSNNRCSSSCYRPLQQLYKTVYSSMNGNNSSNVNFACICRPAERYKTTNMGYGSFYYDNQISTTNDRVINYDRAIFAQCYDNKKKMGSQSKGNNRAKGSFSISNPNDTEENQYWTQTTSDACCPTDCCDTPAYNTTNCMNNDPCYSQNSIPSTTNKTSNVHVCCV